MISHRPPLTVVVAACLAALVALAPLAYLVDRAVSEGWTAVVHEVWRDRTARLMWRSVVLTVVVTGLSVVVGVGAAWLVERSDLPGRGALRIGFALPLAMPSYLAAFAWISWLPSLAGLGGAVLVLTSISFPFVYLPVAAAIRQLDPALEETARTLGRSRWRATYEQTIRPCRPTIVGGALLVALYALSDFGAVAAMRYEAFTWVIYGAYRAGFNPGRAAVLSCCLVALALLLVAAESAGRGRADRARLGAGSPRTGDPVRLGWATLPAIAAVAVVLGATLVVPIVRIVWWAVTYRSTDVDVGAVLSAGGQTIWLAVLAALASTALALPVGLLAARWRSRPTRLVEQATYLAHALPGIVVAISLVYLGVRTFRPIYQRTPLLILGYVVLFLPLAVSAVRSAIERAPKQLEEVSHSLGRSRWSTWMRVTAPLAAPGIVAGAALVMVSTMKELPVTLVLRPTTTVTLAGELWKHATISDYGNAAPFAIAIVVAAAVPAAILGTIARAAAGRR